MLHLAILLLTLPLAPGQADPAPAAGVQAREVPAATTATLAAADEATRQIWERLTRVGAPARAKPLTAFALKAEVRARDGARSNDLEIDLRYLHPKGVRFLPQGGGETGRFGTGRGDYWLKDGDEVVMLIGRDYKEDRRKVDEMAVLARNFLALSDLETLEITSLRPLERPSALLPGNLAQRLGSRKYTWIAVTTPDFGLLGGETGPQHERKHVVELCLAEPKGDDTSLVPIAALLFELDAPADADPRAPLLIQLDRYEQRDGFQVPGRLRTHLLEQPSPLEAPHFSEVPAQEVAIVELDLRPQFTESDFRP